MRRVFFIIIIIYIANIKCHVINSTKLKATKFLAKENVPKVDDMEGRGASVYLEDVIFSIASQNWTEDEKPCLDHIHRMLHGLQNFTLWAVWGEFCTYLTKGISYR